MLRDILAAVGVAHFAVAEAAPVDDGARSRYERWIADGMNAGMDYMQRYADVRSDPRLLLDGASSIIVCAFPYWHPDARRTSLMAAYALATDYHEVVRRRLDAAAASIRLAYGGATRVCVDTAPLRERYWAQRSGLGFIGRNGHLIIPGAGSWFFLGEILTTARLEPYSPGAPRRCLGCGRCVKACPAGALTGDGTVDARRCLSYLTIEHRGEFPDGTDLHGCLYGCDTCARVCPHNAEPEVTTLPEFTPRPGVVGLTAERAAALTQEEFSALFTHSAVKRAKLAGMRRNALALLRRK